MPLDCSVTNWFYNLIKAKPAGEGGGDKQGSAESSEQGMQFWVFTKDSVRTDAGLSWPGFFVITADINPMTPKLAAVSGFWPRRRP